MEIKFDVRTLGIADMPQYRIEQRIIQLELGTTLPLEFKEMEELQISERWENAYNNTGL